MMLSSFAALSSLFISAQAATLAAQSTECFTTHTGYLKAGGSDFGIDSGNLIVWGYNVHNSTKIKLSLQACPQLTKYGPYNYPTAYYGRLVALETASIPANQCLTATPSPTNATVLHGKLKSCGSAYVPAADQSFFYTKDAQNVYGYDLYFAGEAGCTANTGTLVVINGTTYTNGDPLTTQGSDLWQLRCNSRGQTAAFGLSGTINSE